MVKASSKGFTLIELMIVVAIIGIIAALAYPSYMESVRRANRAEAKSSLADAAHRLQRCYTTYAQFDNASCAVYSDLSGPGITTPGRGFYSVTIGGVTPRAYTLTATAVLSPQTGDTNEGCNVMTLNQLGVREPEACW